MSERIATLVIDRWFSSCSYCGGNADPDEKYHIHGGPKSLFDKGSSLDDMNGCGARFTDVFNVYSDRHEEDLPKL